MTRQHGKVAPDTEDENRLRYSSIRAGIPDDMPATMLHIGAQQTVVAAGDGVEPETMLTLAIGSRKTAADYFKHNPPAPEELEQAIAAVEDEVMRARTRHTQGSRLFTTDAAIREIALLAGIPEQPECILALDAMERLFGRLAAVTLGRSASQEGIPDSSAFAATLLILREFMQHLKFLSITIKT